MTTDVTVAMRDETRLAADVYRPARDGSPATGKFPTVLVRTPYDKAKQWVVQGIIDPDFFTAKGYAVVIQDVRGRYRSEGSFYHGVTEGVDGYDTIEWIATQPFSNGKVGMTGMSYSSVVEVAAALTQPPHLASMFHVRAPSSFYHNGFRHGGALRLFKVPSTLAFMMSGQLALADPTVMSSLLEAKATDWVGEVPLERGLSPLALDPEYEAWFFDIAEHEDYDDYWKGVPCWEADEHFDRMLDVPQFYLGGWYDTYREDTFYIGLAGRHHGALRLMMGPWTGMDLDGHAGEISFGDAATLPPDEYNRLMLRWFDSTMGESADDSLEEPPVEIFIMGGGDGKVDEAGRVNHGGRWRSEMEWPLSRATPTAYYLHPDGRLSPTPSDDGPGDTYIYDPDRPVPTIGGTSGFHQVLTGPEYDHLPLEERTWDHGDMFVRPGAFDQRERLGQFGCTSNLPLSSRSDVLVFATEPLGEAIEVTGPISLRLWVSSSAVDTDFTAKLIDVYPQRAEVPNGFAMNVCDSILRVRYRNSFESPEMMVPGDVYEIAIELPTTSNLFALGHRIRLDISSSNYPTYDTNPNTGAPLHEGGSSLVAENTIYYGPGRPSRIVLPVIPLRSGGESSEPWFV